jgi:acyl-CoA thioester hydrolase
MSVTVQVPVRWVDLDALGHVNNAVYLNYLEEARDRLLESSLGAEYANAVIARVEIDYRHEIARAVPHVVVSAAIESVGTSSIRSVEEIRLPDGTLSAQARTVTVIRTTDGSGSRPLTSAEREALTGEG